MYFSILIVKKMSNKVDVKIKKERAVELEELKQSMVQEIRKKYLGKKIKFLVEEIKVGKALGYSENYLRVKVENKKLIIGEIYEVLITKIEKEVLISE